MAQTICWKVCILTMNRRHAGILRLQSKTAVFQMDARYARANLVLSFLSQVMNSIGQEMAIDRSMHEISRLNYLTLHLNLTRVKRPSKESEPKGQNKNYRIITKLVTGRIQQQTFTTERISYKQHLQLTRSVCWTDERIIQRMEWFNIS